MNSDIKPDFEKFISKAWESANKFHDRNGGVNPVPFTMGGKYIWNHQVEPLLSTVKRLQEEKKELMKHLFILTSIPPQSQSYYKDIDDAIAIYNKYKES